MDFSLSQLRWKYRPLLLFSPGENDPALHRQQKLIDDATDALKERDMVVIRVVASATGHYFDPATGKLERLSEETVKQLRLDHDVLLGDFALILIGKDGTEKRRERVVTPLQPIFNQIDSMPMRKEEMRDAE